MTEVLRVATTIFTLPKDFLRVVEHFARRGTISWNILGVVEQFRGTFASSWNNPARPGCGTFSASWNISVEHFCRRGTIFFQKKGLTLFFSPLFCAPFSWNIFPSVEHFAVPTSFF